MGEPDSMAPSTDCGLASRLSVLLPLREPGVLGVPVTTLRRAAVR